MNIHSAYAAARSRDRILAAEQHRGPIKPLRYPCRRNAYNARVPVLPVQHYAAPLGKVLIGKLFAGGVEYSAFLGLALGVQLVKLCRQLRRALPLGLHKQAHRRVRFLYAACRIQPRRYSEAEIARAYVLQFCLGHGAERLYSLLAFAAAYILDRKRGEHAVFPRERHNIRNRCNARKRYVFPCPLAAEQCLRHFTGKPRAAYMPVRVFVRIVAKYQRLAFGQRVARDMMVCYYNLHAKLVAALRLRRGLNAVIYRYYKIRAHVEKLLRAFHGHAVAVLMPRRYHVFRIRAKPPEAA